MIATTITNLHPCIACGMNAPRATDAAHRLCDGCAADLPATQAHVTAMLTAATAALDTHRAAWVQRQAALPDELAARWSRLVAARSAAEGAVIAFDRGRLAVALTEDMRRARLDGARRRLAEVQQKITRTRAAVPDLAALLDEEAAVLAEERRLQREVERWSIAKQELAEIGGTTTWI
jgi:hypothetical protein